MKNILEYSCTEEGMVSGKYIFEGSFKFESSEARNSFGSTASAVQREEYRYVSTSTQEHQKLEGKLIRRVK